MAGRGLLFPAVEVCQAPVAVGLEVIAVAGWLLWRLRPAAIAYLPVPAVSAFGDTWGRMLVREGTISGTADNAERAPGGRRAHTAMARAQPLPRRLLLLRGGLGGRAVRRLRPAVAGGRRPRPGGPVDGFHGVALLEAGAPHRPLGGHRRGRGDGPLPAQRVDPHRGADVARAADGPVHLALDDGDRGRRPVGAARRAAVGSSRGRVERGLAVVHRLGHLDGHGA